MRFGRGEGRIADINRFAWVEGTEGVMGELIVALFIFLGVL